MSTWEKSAPEVSSAPPSGAGAALEARKWLDGQISPPRHPVPRRMRNAAAVTLPLLMPPSAAQEGHPTPRLTPAQADIQVRIHCPHVHFCCSVAKLGLFYHDGYQAADVGHSFR